MDIDKLKKLMQQKPQLSGVGGIQKPRITTDFNIDELQNKANQNKVTQPTTPSNPITTQPIQQPTDSASQATQKMWTGSGWASVNPAYADEYLAKGWTYEGPSSSQMNELIGMAQQGSQGVWTPDGIKTLEGSTTTSTPTSTTTNTYNTMPGYQTINANTGKNLLDLFKNQSDSNRNPITTQPINPTTDSYKPLSQTDLTTQLATAQKNKAIAELQAAYQKNLGALSEAEQKGIKQAEQGRSQIRSQGIMNAKAFEDYLASKGLSSSGVAPQGYIQQQGQTQGQLGASQLQQAQMSSDIERQRANLATDLESGKVSIGADYDIQALQNQIAQQDRQELYNRQDWLMRQGWAREDALRQAELETQQKNKALQSQIDTIGQYSDFTAEIQRREALNPNDPLLPYLRLARQNKRTALGMDASGNIIPVDNTQEIWNMAYKKWNSGIPLTQQEMQVLGTPTPTQPVAPRSTGSSGTSQSNAIARWKALGYADDTVASYFGIPVGSKYGEGYTQFQQPQSTGMNLNVNAPTKNDVLSNMQGSLTKRADYLATLILSGQLDAIASSDPALYNEIERIADNYGITEDVLDQAIARRGVSSQSYGAGNTIQPLTQYR